MSAEIVRVGPHTGNLMAKIAAEGAKSDTFTREEKLALVADGMMDPKEVGLVSQEEAVYEIAPEQKPRPNFGNEVFMQAGIVPIELRAQWAYDEMKLRLTPKDKTAWVQEWISKNQKTYRVQASIRSGNIEAKFERTYSDPVLGLANMLKLAGEQMEAAYLGKPCQPTSDNGDKELPAPDSGQKLLRSNKDEETED